MTQFDVFINQNPDTNTQIPYLLNIQNDILNNLSTTVVVPLILNIKSIYHLNPTFLIENKKVVMSTTEIGSIPVSYLGDKVCSLTKERREILNAIDFLITGY